MDTYEKAKEREHGLIRELEHTKMALKKAQEDIHNLLKINNKLKTRLMEKKK